MAAPGTQDQSPCGKIRCLYDLHDFLNGSSPAFLHPVIDNLHHCIHHFPQVMGRNIGSHSHGDSRGTVYQQVGIPAGKHHWFPLCVIEIGHKIHGILVDVSQQFHGNLRKPCLRVTHGSSTVTIHGSEVPMTVHQGIPGRPFLGHIHQGAIDGTISVGMVFTHGITYDTGALPVWFVRPVIQFDHGIEHPALHRF